MDAQKISFVGQTLNGGRFISRGRGRHPERRIESDELIYVVNGRLDIFEQQQSFSLAGGEWLILRRGRRHGGLADYPQDLSFYWLHFIDEAGALDALPQHGRATRPERLTAYCQSFLAEQQESEPDAETQQLLFSLIFRELQRSEQAAAPGTNPTPLAAAAAKVIRLRFAEPLTTASLSRELRCNAEYLGRLYQLQYGESIARTVNRHRVEHAARLLTGENVSIKEIMQQCGFNDPAYFRRQFRRRYAVSPGEFRRLYTSGYLNTE